MLQALRPALWQTRDLPAALAHLVEQTTAGTAVSRAWVVQEQARALLPLVEEDLLRVAQEALPDALRPSGANQVSIELSFSAQTLHLGVEEDGQGFAALAAPPGGHFGLRGMRERTQRLGGPLAIRSQAGEGTQIRVVLPDQKGR